jgi:FtsP/CotA-like multicopper oxidase with cupredoxin domain
MTAMGLSGVQLDRSLYGPLIVKDPAEDLVYDREFTVILDDWLDGIEGTPGDVLAQLRAESVPHGGMGGMERVLRLDDFEGTPTAGLDDRMPARTYRVQLTGGMHAFEWGIEGEKVDGVTLPVREGERVRLILDNDTMMWHPMHLHSRPLSLPRAHSRGSVVGSALLGWSCSAWAVYWWRIWCSISNATLG